MDVGVAIAPSPLFHAPLPLVMHLMVRRNLWTFPNALSGRCIHAAPTLSTHCWMPSIPGASQGTALPGLWRGLGHTTLLILACLKAATTWTIWQRCCTWVTPQQHSSIMWICLLTFRRGLMGTRRTYRIIEWFGLEGTLKITYFSNPPAMGRDTFH